jgi:8-oxo-dGTP pyrophosphatase MutT (NUDIX family)
MTWKPDVTVAAVIEDAGRFLIVEERIGNRLVFNQPAGHLEANESLIEAAVRETLEETGWTFEPHALVGVYLWKPPERPKSFLRVTFSGRVTHHDPTRPLDRGIHRALWFSRDQLAARTQHLRSPMVLRCIDDYLRGRRFPLEIVDYVAEDVASAATAQASE